MSGITLKKQSVLNTALSAIKTLGEDVVSAESKESPLKQFFELLIDYEKNRAIYRKQQIEKRAKTLEAKAGKPFSPAAAAAPQAETKEIPDPDLTLIDQIKRLDAVALRKALMVKAQQNPTWNSLLVFLNEVSPVEPAAAENEEKAEDKEGEAEYEGDDDNDEEESKKKGKEREVEKAKYEAKYQEPERLVFRDEDEERAYAAALSRGFQFKG